MWTCYLCEKETVIMTRFCEACQETKRIFAIYGASECRDILKRVCIRGKDQREYKLDGELKKIKDVTGDFPKSKHLKKSNSESDK